MLTRIVGRIIGPFIKYFGGLISTGFGLVSVCLVISSPLTRANRVLRGVTADLLDCVRAIESRGSARIARIAIRTRMVWSMSDSTSWDELRDDVSYRHEFRIFSAAA